MIGCQMEIWTALLISLETTPFSSESRIWRLLRNRFV